MDHRDEYRRELRSYIVGLGLAVVLSALAFGGVAWGGVVWGGMAWGGLSRTAVLWIVGAAAAAQIAVHFRFFLHIDLSQSKRDDLQLILFSALIVFMMAGGTIWILADLKHRMM